MSITIDQLPAIVLEIQSKIVDVLGKQPYIPFDIECNTGVKPWRGSFYEDAGMKNHHSWQAETVDDLVLNIQAELKTWPTVEEQNLRDFQKDLTKLIDKGHESGIDAQFVEPLRPVAKALTDNLLTYQEAV